MHSRRIRWVLASVGVAIAATALYVHTTYLFSPLTHKQDAITHLPWLWYREPLQLEYGILDDDGWHFAKSSDSREMRLIVAELRKGLFRPEPDNYGMTITEDKGNTRIWFGVRRLRDNAVLLSVQGNGSSGVVKVNGQAQAVITESLLSLLQEKMDQARQTSQRGT